MIRLVHALLLLLCVLPAAMAQPFLPPQAAPGYDLSDKDKDTVRVVAIQASRQDAAQAGTDDTLKSFEKIFRGMPEFNTFRLVSDASTQITRGEEGAIPIDARYAMHVVTGVGSDPQKRNLAARITLDGTVDALRAQGVTEPGKIIVFRGMEHAPGELVVLLQIVPEQQDSQPSSGGDDQNQEQQQDQQEQQGDKGKQDEQQEQKDKMQGRQEQEQQIAKAAEKDEEEKGAAPPKQEEANIEALLQSLDEVDRREQQNMLNANKRFPKIHGDWW
jgi:hypothetical protein